ncbi:MAG: hypothetical protein R3F25_03755 [Gammaproteobacteria bacterium]
MMTTLSLSGMDSIILIEMAAHFSLYYKQQFLDGITQRQMRKVLLETFDTIYVLDLYMEMLRKWHL